MTPLEIIAEWRKGCSKAPTGEPAACMACTVAMVAALERELSIKKTHAVIANRTHASATVEPIAVVDFYADDKKGSK